MLLCVEPWGNSLTLHCSSSLSCLNEYLAMDSDGYLYMNNPHIHCGLSFQEKWLVLNCTDLPGSTV